MVIFKMKRVCWTVISNLFTLLFLGLSILFKKCIVNINIIIWILDSFNWKVIEAYDMWHKNDVNASKDRIFSNKDKWITLRNSI